MLYGGVFVALESIIAKIGHDHPAFHGGSAWLVQFTALLPALIGIGLGRNPSGFLNDAFASWGPLIRRTKPVLFTGIAAELLAWLLALRHTIDNWTFALFTGALAVVLPRVAAAVNRSAYPRDRSKGEEPARDAIPLELLGVDHAFTTDDLHAINRGAGFERLPT
jgi:hypothetical protein